MPLLSVRTMTTNDESPAIDTVVLGFAADPMARWSWPRSHDYLTNMPSLVRRSAATPSRGRAQTARTTTSVSPSGSHPAYVPTKNGWARLCNVRSKRPFGTTCSRCSSRWRCTTRVDLNWYLPLIAVDPAHQGRGHGDALMTHGLQRCDRDHVPVYLEFTNPRNVPLYQRHGFEVMGTIQVGSSPPLVPMLRPPR